MKHAHQLTPVSRPDFTTAIIDPVAAEGFNAGIRPEFIRLPPPGQQCQFSGLSRSGLNSLILSTADNNFSPPVRSYVLRKKGAKTGVRLIDYSSLSIYIRQHEEPTTAPDPTADHPGASTWPEKKP